MNKNHSKSLYVTISIFSILCTTLFLIFMIYSITNEKKSLIVKEKNSLLNINSVVALEASDYLGEIRLSLKTADLWLKSHPDADPRTDKAFIELIDTFREDAKEKVDIRLVSEKGELFYIQADPMKSLAVVKDREYFTAQQNNATRGFYIASPVMSRVTGKWGIPISYPLSSKNNGISIAFVSVEAPDLKKTWEPLRTKPGGAIALIREDGIILGTSPFDESVIGKSINNVKLWSNVVKNVREGVKTYNETGNEGSLKLVACQKLNGFPLYIANTADMRDVIAPWKDTLTMKIVIIVILLFVIIGLVVIMISLVNKLNKAMEEITYMSNTDPLTGIYNRRFINQQLAQEIERARRYATPFSLILLDIDYFKNINDTYGHEIGDVSIKAISKILLDNVRRTDFVARWGGEEFLILCVNTEIAEGKILAEKLRSNIEKREFETAKHITSSFGVSSYGKGDELTTLLEGADKALYVSKNNGRNCVTVEKKL